MDISALLWFRPTRAGRHRRDSGIATMDDPTLAGPSWRRAPNTHGSEHWNWRPERLQLATNESASPHPSPTPRVSQLGAGRSGSEMYHARETSPCEAKSQHGRTQRKMETTDRAMACMYCGVQNEFGGICLFSAIDMRRQRSLVRCVADDMVDEVVGRRRFQRSVCVRARNQ